MQLVHTGTGLEFKQPPTVIQVQDSFLGFELQQLLSFHFIFYECQKKKKDGGKKAEYNTYTHTPPVSQI